MSIDRRGTTLVVKVAENPIVASVYLEGNAAIDKAKLQEQIELKPRARYTAAKAHADACACAMPTGGWDGLPPRSSRAWSISPTDAWR